ncbi:hypothetical protein C8R45DRAFT_1130766 [Mycena sanguinolenta]|nr:hypothetical protein C8R45DRAFT_1130766 [Mycena sanguinolenta]
MGGFVSSAGHPIATLQQLKDPAHGSEFQAAIRSINEEHIMDKSKGDAFSKGVALLQGLWFTMQYLARVHQRLAMTQLEVATLAFAVVNIFIWLLWWNKPLDVQRPTVVGPLTPPDPQATISHVQLSPFNRLFGAIFGFDTDEYQPLASTSVPSLWYIPLGAKFESGALFIMTLVGTVFGAVHCAAWNVVFPTLTEMWLWRVSSPAITAMPGITSLLFLMTVGNELDLVLAAFFIILVVWSPMYIPARVILIVLPFASLRSLPPSAFVDVNWSTYIPHI